MALKTKTVKISGVPSDNGWSQSFEYTFENGQIEPGLFIVFSTIRRNSDLDDAVLGREILNKFRQEYFQEKGKLPDLALKDAVKKVFNEFFQKLDGLEIAAASYVDGVFYTSCVNGGKTSLYRDGFLVKILDSTSPHLVSASGFPKEKDVMVLATDDFFKEISFSEIKDAFAKGLEETKDIFSMKLHNASTSSVAIIQFLNKTIETEDVPERVPLSNLQSDIGSEAIEPVKKKEMVSVFGKLKHFLPGRKIYLHGQTDVEVPIKSKKTFFVGLVLTILLAVSVFFGIYKNKKDIYKNSYADTLNSAKVNIEDAVRLKNVEVGKSRELLLSGRELLNKLENDGIKDPEIDTLKTIVRENESEILGERKVQADLWLDLSLIVDGFNGSQIVFDGEKVYVSDFLKDTIINIAIQSKKSATVKIPGEIGDPVSMTVKADNTYLLGDDGIYQLSKKQKVIDKNWDNAKMIASFASNIYVLDTEKGEILKSAGTDSGFSAGKKWTTSDSEDFSSVKSFAVDGFAWVLTADGVNKYSYGNNLKFALKEYPYEIPTYDSLYTDENAGNLYLLNKEGKKISVFDKDGVYKYNLISETIGDGFSLIVSETEGKILLLTGEKLYSIPLPD